MKHPGGRPRKYSKKFRRELLQEFYEYINKTKMPVIADFASQHWIPKSTFYDWPEFSNLLSVCKDKKEHYLQKNGLAGNTNAAVTIFTLKQLGWRDKIENINTNIDIKGTEDTLEKIYDCVK